MNRFLASSICILFVLCVATTSDAFAAEPRLAGKYSCAGKNAEGGTYTGAATIAKTGATYSIKWEIDVSGETYQGTGIIVDDVLAVGYPGGVVAYKIDTTKGVRLVGKWAGDGKSTSQNETLSKK